MPYIYYNPNPRHLDTDDCTIRAISKLLDFDWDTTFLRIAFQGFSQKQMMVSDSVWGQYLKDNGFRIVPLPNTCPNCYTVRQFAKDHPYGRYLVKTYEHVVAVIDGDYYDTSDTGDMTPIYYFERMADRYNAEL